jgi:hypothetical protein
MYKLVAIDMDGTLLNDEGKISDRTKTAIKKATAQGVKIVLNSGRPIEGLMPYLKQLGLDTQEDYVVGFNGAIVQNVATREVLFSQGLTGKDLAYLYSLAKKIGSNIHAFSKEGCITPKMSPYSQVEADLNSIPVLEIDYDTVADDAYIAKIMLIDPQEILEANIKKLPSEVYDRYTVVRSTPFFLEFLHTEVNKGAGIAALAENLGIAQQEVICIGDAGNDMHMIEYAGLGVAMGNAIPELKQKADYITTTNNEDGVAHVIEKFCLS